MTAQPRIRRTLHPGDLDAIVAHHGRVYRREHGLDASFVDAVAGAVASAAARGFPGECEAVRIVELDGTHAGSIALTDEGDGAAAVRWFLLEATLRGRGLGRRLLDEVLSVARESGYKLVWLGTFSELEAAAHLYLERGFRLASQDVGPRWGRERITYQRYELGLRAPNAPDRHPGDEQQHKRLFEGSCASTRREGKA